MLVAVGVGDGSVAVMVGDVVIVGVRVGLGVFVLVGVCEGVGVEVGVETYAYTFNKQDAIKMITAISPTINAMLFIFLADR